MQLEVLVDFVDDVLMAPCVITREHIAALMHALAERGVRRVVWGYYGDTLGGYCAPEGYVTSRHRWHQYGAVYRERNPLAEAVAAAHRYGLEIYAYYKPYEKGPALLFPSGSPEARAWGKLDHIGGRLVWLDPFIVKRPDLRIMHRDAQVGARQGTPVTSIRLFKRDDGPTRVNAEHLEIWTSATNYRYTRAHVRFDLRSDVMPCPEDVFDIHDNVVAAKGAPIRTLTLDGLDLRDPYVLVTTKFRDGPADFENIGLDMLRAYDADGREIDGVCASRHALYGSDQVNFRDWGLVFDCGWQREMLTLDEDSSSGRAGFVAFARGRNPYLSGALCETEPEAQQCWLSNLRAILDTGVDGVEFRVENHSTHTDYPEQYGYNPVVMAECERSGTDIAAVRGNAYTDFLRRAKTLIAGRGKQMRVNLNVDWFGRRRPPCRRPAYPANITFQWERWIEEGLMDQATLRSYHWREEALTNAFAFEITERCRAANLPVAFNHHVFRDDPWFLEEFQRVKADGRFSSCILYEANSFTQYSGTADCAISLPVVEAICRDQDAPEGH